MHRYDLKKLIRKMTKQIFFDKIVLTDFILDRCLKIN